MIFNDMLKNLLARDTPEYRTRQSRISRTPYPQLGGPTLSQGAQNSVSSPLSPQRKLRSPNWNVKH